MKFKSTVTLVAAFSLCVCMACCGRHSTVVIENSQIPDVVAEGELVTTEVGFEATDTEVFVYICGAVEVPGVYSMSNEARVCDLIEVAGGFTEDAKTDYYNQAELLYDGEKIYIPTEEEYNELYESLNPDASQESADRGISSDGKININYADATQLQQIPGVGESKAAAIIEYRNTNGAFSAIEDITSVSGIGEATFENMKDYITVSQRKGEYGKEGSGRR